MKRIVTVLICLFFLPHSFALGSTHDAKKFSDGYRNNFSTAGHSKSKGLNITISYPKSWVAKESERPNIVQKSISKGGKGQEMALVITKSLPYPTGTIIPENELKDFFKISEMKNMLPAGATFIAANQTKIEGLPAGVIEYLIRQARAGGDVYIQTIAYTFIHKTTLVQLQCSVTSTAKLAKPADLAQRMTEFNPLFMLMAKSIILNDK